MSKRLGDPGYAAGWCIHYRYNRDAKKPEDDTCEAGIAYLTVRPKIGPTFKSQPCFLDDKSGESKPGAGHCALLRCPTPEEIALHEKWVADRMGLLRKVMQGIRPWCEAHKGRSAQEVVDCPGCGGRLHLSIDSYKGHIHGRCETEHCVSWME